MTTERQFIQQLQHRFPAKAPVDVGIGDDGAVLNCADERQQIVVTDMLLDQVHFDLKSTSPRLAGRKAVAVNLSDLAAMACWPTAAFISIAVPRRLRWSDRFLGDVYDGIAALADEYEFCIAGGDTNVWDGPFAVNVCMTGVPMGSSAILRSGARLGDKLFITGPLGGSLASNRHLSFEPRVHLSKWLVDNTEVHAMMDISDGLGIDLHRLMEASGTGALLFEDQIPIHDDVPRSSSNAERLNAAFSDGEDFELLFAVSDADSPTLQSGDNHFHLIGHVTDECGHVFLEAPDGGRSVVGESGWQHS